MTTFPFPPQKATVNEVFLEKSSCVIAAAALCSPKEKVGPVLGCDETNWLQALHFLCLSALRCSWRGGPAEEGPKGCVAAKCSLCWRENSCTIQSKYHFTITSSKEELWRIKQLIGLRWDALVPTLKFGQGNEAHTFHCCTQINQYFQAIFHNQHW